MVTSSSMTRIAAGAFLGMLLVTGVLVLTSDLRVEDMGTVIVFCVAVLSVVLLLYGPTETVDQR
jgi:hypothetical protein